MSNDKNKPNPPADSSVAAVPDAGKQITDIPIDKIRFNPHWHRTDFEEDLGSMVESIRTDGLLHFPAVAANGDGNYTLIFGHRRYASYKRLGKKTIPCRVIKATPLESALRCFTENVERSKLHPVDQALHLKDLKEMSQLSDERIAKKIHRNQSFVTDRLGILDLPPDIVGQIGTKREDRFRFAHAVELSPLSRTDRFNRDQEIRLLFDKTVRDKLTSQQLQGHVALVKDGHYDRLPAKLRGLVFTNPWMTPKVAALFLCPEEFFKGTDSEDGLLREKARNLSADERENIVLTALEERWPQNNLTERFRSMLARSLHREFKRDEDPVKFLDSQFSSFCHKLRDSEHTFDDFPPDALVRLCHMCRQLIEYLEDFQGNADRVAKDKNNTANNNRQEDHYESKSAV